MKHSKFGIASFVTALLSALLIFILFIVAGVLETTTPGGMDEKSAAAMIVGLVLFAFLFLSLISAGLGIGGLFEKDRKKIFAILGVIFSLLTLLGTIGLVVLGLAMG
jgi:hypothetical protein